MTPAMIERRLEAIEREIAALAPPAAPPEWLHWTTNGELDWLEKLYRDLETNGGEPTQADQLRAWSIYAAATARIIEGGPRP